MMSIDKLFKPLLDEAVKIGFESHIIGLGNVCIYSINKNNLIVDIKTTTLSIHYIGNLYIIKISESVMGNNFSHGSVVLERPFFDNMTLESINKICIENIRYLYKDEFRKYKIRRRKEKIKNILDE